MRLTGVRIVAYALTLVLAAARGDEDEVATSDDPPTSGTGGRCGDGAVAARRRSGYFTR